MDAYFLKSPLLKKKYNINLLKAKNDYNKLSNKNYISANDLNYYFITPKDNELSKQHMMNQFKLLGIPETNIHIIQAYEFSKYISHKMNDILLSMGHLKMLEKSHDNNDKYSCFFEDDIIFNKDFKVILEYILNNFNPDIIRFDNAPVISIENQKNNEIYISDNNGIFPYACLGGYLMSQESIKKTLDFIKNNEWRWDTFEYLIKEISTTFFMKKCYDTIPKLCLQNWHLEKTNIQSDADVIKRALVNAKYYNRYKDRFFFDDNDLYHISNKLNKSTYNEEKI